MKSIELFSGAGGLALGIHLAGFRHQLLVEADTDAYETLRANRDKEAVAGIGEWSMLHAKVESIDLTGFAGVELLAAGIPCQPFSNGGMRRGLEDERDMFPVFAKALATVRPSAFLLENVNGLLHGRLADHMAYVVLQLSQPTRLPAPGQPWRRHLDGLLAAAADRGSPLTSYQVSFHVLNAADYGVPQIRKRVFIVGFRKDLELTWDLPRPTHSREALLSAQGLGSACRTTHRCGAMPSYTPMAHSDAPTNYTGATEPWRTVRDAVGDLPEATANPQTAMQHMLIPGARSYKGHTGSQLNWPAKSLKAGVHGVGGGENMLRCPSGEVRYFTVRECARLQTFPDCWEFKGPWSKVTRQLGNAVPVHLAMIVANSIRYSLAKALA